MNFRNFSWAMEKIPCRDLGEEEKERISLLEIAHSSREEIYHPPKDGSEWMKHIVDVG